MPHLPTLLKMVFWPDRKDIAAVNRFFLPSIVTMGGIIGSVLSMIIVGGMLLASLQIARGIVELPRNKEVRIVALCLASFFAAELLSGLVNFNGMPTAKEIFENLPFLGFLPLYAIILRPREKIREWIEKAAIFSSFAVCALAVVQFYFFYSRALGGAGNAGVFGVMCLLLFSIDFLAILRHRHARRALAGCALLAAMSALILSGMRALWPGLLLMPAVIFVIYWHHLHHRISKRFLSSALIFLTLLGFALYQPVRDRIDAVRYDLRQLQENNYTTSLGLRVAVWKASYDLLSEKPLLGQGPGRAKPLLGEKTKEISGMAFYSNHFHNAVLTIWVRSGILGVLAMIAIFVVPLLRASKYLDDEPSIYGFALLVTLELSYMISGTTGIALGHDIMDTVFIGSLTLALYMILGQDVPATAPGGEKEQILA